MEECVSVSLLLSFCLLLVARGINNNTMSVVLFFVLLHAKQTFYVYSCSKDTLITLSI